MSKQESKIRQAVKEAEDAQQRQNQVAEFQSYAVTPGCKTATSPQRQLNSADLEQLKDKLRNKAMMNVTCALLARTENGEEVINEALEPLLDTISNRPEELKQLEAVLDEWETRLKDSLKKPS